MSIAERLRAMEDYAASENDKPITSKTTTTTESLTTILIQTLQSNDDDALESAVLTPSVPETTIRHTLEKLSSPLLLERLAETLVVKLGRQPFRAKRLGVWLRILISVCVARGEETRGVLATILPLLRNLIGERMECMTGLMMLEGRLELVCGGASASNYLRLGIELLR
jgi:hypothetical protein